SEWDANTIVSAACSCLREVSRRLGAGWARLAGLGITGQQHGAAIVDQQRPLTPLINWQDRRGEDTYPAGSLTYIQETMRRVGDRDDTVLVNVGTGGQVSVWSDEFRYDPMLETRPFPGGGYLLACVGLCGGRSYAALERFYRQVGEQLLGGAAGEPLYAIMNR